jgi:transcriptional regulator with XRE-family HTH domain
MSQTDLARASGVSQSAIASYENGSRKTAKGIFKLANALQVDPAWLSMGVGHMEALPGSTNAIKVQEPAKEAWPFSTIPLADYWALSTHERRLIENTLRTMMQTLLARKA